MTEELFLKNLQIVEHLSQTDIIALIGRYFFGYQVKIIRFGKKNLPLAKLKGLIRPPVKRKSFAITRLPYDDSVWQELPNWDRDGRAITKLLGQLEDYKFYITLDGGKTLYTFFNRYQVSGIKFEEATLKAILLMCLLKQNISLADEDLKCLIPENTGIDTKHLKDRKEEDYQTKYGVVKDYVQKSWKQIKAESTARTKARKELEAQQAADEV